MANSKSAPKYPHMDAVQLRRAIKSDPEQVIKNYMLLQQAADTQHRQIQEMKSYIDCARLLINKTLTSFTKKY